MVSNDLFNKHTGLAIVCPVTNTDRGYPFHLAIPGKSSLTGFVMVEQVKSVDFAMRRAKFVERAPAEFVEDVLDLLTCASAIRNHISSPKSELESARSTGSCPNRS